MPGLTRRLLPIVLLLTVVAVGSYSSESRAHEGPPFPLFMDEPLGELRVSLWADPDIGDAEFFVVLETSKGTSPSEEPRVAIWVQPISGRLARALYPAEKQSLRNRMQFQAKPYFDQQDYWKIGVTVIGADGKQQELLAEVESTPPGLGPWDLAIYLFPFVLIGSLWGLAMVRRHKGVPRQAAHLAVANTSAKPSASALNRSAQVQESQATTGGAR